MQKGSKGLDREQFNEQLSQQVQGFFSSKIVWDKFEEMTYMAGSPLYNGLLISQSLKMTRMRREAQ